MHPETISPRTTRTGIFLVLGTALLHTGISLANTMVMATSDRVRELAVLRLVGAEALLVVTVGGVLGALVAALNMAGMWSALRLLSVRASVEVPWASLAAALGACAVLAVTSALAAAAVSLRRRAVEVAGVRE